MEKKSRPPVPDLFVMVVVGLHIPDCIDTDQGTDDTDDQGHDDGELVNKQVIHDMQVTGKACLKPDKKACLQQDQDYGQRLPVPDTEPENEHGQHQLDKEHDLADRF